METAGSWQSFDGSLVSLVLVLFHKIAPQVQQVKEAVVDRAALSSPLPYNSGALAPYERPFA
jgi:hypothetical protein